MFSRAASSNRKGADATRNSGNAVSSVPGENERVKKYVIPIYSHVINPS
jgi:hypothetical protein